MKRFRFSVWRAGVRLSIMTCTAALLLTGCGTFEVNVQLATPASDNAPSGPTITSTVTVTPTSIGLLPEPATPETVIAHLDVPRLDGAQVLVDISTRLIYRSDADLAAAIAFYESQMPASGWTKVSQTRQNNDDVLLTFSRNDELVSVEIRIDGLGLMVEAKTQP